MRRVSFCLLTSLLLASALTLLPRAATTARASAEPATVLASPAQDDASAFWKQGTDYYNAGRFAEAVEAYKQYIRLRPEVAEARYWLGSSYYSLKQYELPRDRKSTRLNSSHVSISYAVFCLK